MQLSSEIFMAQRKKRFGKPKKRGKCNLRNRLARRTTNKKQNASCVMIFLIPPSKEVLLSRLKNRGTDSDQEIAYRFNQAVLDLEQSNMFDHVLVNDQLDKVVAEDCSLYRWKG